MKRDLFLFTDQVILLLSTGCMFFLRGSFHFFLLFLLLLHFLQFSLGLGILAAVCVFLQARDWSLQVTETLHENIAINIYYDESAGCFDWKSHAIIIF